jgi:hypoxanthine phosphoribosyltransferase
MDKPLFISAEIQSRLKEVSFEITGDYQDKTPIVLGVLNGCFMFYSDLLKELDFQLEVDFCKIKSYRDNGRGRIQFEKEWSSNIEGRDVLIVEDIVDSGETMKFLLSELQRQSPKSVKICTLLHRVTSTISVDYSLFDLQKDDFVYGYGMDECERKRNLSSIFIKSVNV